MKKLRITAAMAITALLLAGCDNEEQKVVPDPIINVDTETVIELPPLPQGEVPVSSTV